MNGAGGLLGMLPMAMGQGQGQGGGALPGMGFLQMLLGQGGMGGMGGADMSHILTSLGLQPMGFLQALQNPSPYSLLGMMNGTGMGSQPGAQNGRTP
jgi:hypothetical protein